MPSYKTRSLIVKRILWSIVIVLILLNSIAFLHAFKFTHFDSSLNRTKNSGQFTLGQKIQMAVLGVNNPKPLNKNLPDTAYKVVRIKSNKEIECWLINVAQSKGTVVLFHGYGGEKSSMLDKASVFRTLGYNTMLVDFMGCGNSEGNQTTIGYKEAEEVKSCVDFLRQHKENNIILFGTSMGAAAVMRSVAQNQLGINRMIIECPFSTMLQTVKNRFEYMGIPTFPMAHFLVFWGGVINGFNSFNHNPEDYAKQINCPTLLMYGEQDIKVKPWETNSIYSNINGPKQLVTFPNAGHENYLIKYRTEWNNAIANFLSGK